MQPPQFQVIYKLHLMNTWLYYFNFKSLLIQINGQISLIISKIMHD